MKLLLTRRWFTEPSTIGTLAVDGAFVCHTLEDRVPRDDPITVADEGQKVAGTTAIPAGRYRVVLTVSDRAAQGSLWSPRPDHKLPLLLDVHGFEGIRIHSGNTDRNTEGCILVGRGRAVDTITESRAALTTLVRDDRGRHRRRRLRHRDCRYRSLDRVKRLRQFTDDRRPDIGRRLREHAGGGGVSQPRRVGTGQEPVSEGDRFLPGAAELASAVDKTPARTASITLWGGVSWLESPVPLRRWPHRVMVGAP